MKKLFLSAMLLAVFVSACARAPEPLPSPGPTASPAPSAAATPSPISAPSPEPTEEPKELWGFPIDDTHDAFEVDTKGKLGTVLVTVEQDQSENLEFGDFLFSFSVWRADDLTTPIQTMTAESWGCFHWHDEMDANFDGYMDFTYQYALGVQVGMCHLWLWDEERGQFAEEPEFANIPSPVIDKETRIIEGWSRHSAAGDGTSTFHRWEDGKLVCVRLIEAFSPWGETTTISVKDRVNGELQEVFYKEYPWDDIKNEPEFGAPWMCERAKWYDLDYHG